MNERKFAALFLNRRAEPVRGSLAVLFRNARRVTAGVIANRPMTDDQRRAMFAKSRMNTVGRMAPQVRGGPQRNQSAPKNPSHPTSTAAIAEQAMGAARREADLILRQYGATSREYTGALQRLADAENAYRATTAQRPPQDQAATVQPPAGGADSRPQPRPGETTATPGAPNGGYPGGNPGFSFNQQVTDANQIERNIVSAAEHSAQKTWDADRNTLAAAQAVAYRRDNNIPLTPADLRWLASNNLTPDSIPHVSEVNGMLRSIGARPGLTPEQQYIPTGVLAPVVQNPSTRFDAHNLVRDASMQTGMVGMSLTPRKVVPLNFGSPTLPVVRRPAPPAGDVFAGGTPGFDERTGKPTQTTAEILRQAREELAKRLKPRREQSPNYRYDPSKPIIKGPGK